MIKPKPSPAIDSLKAYPNWVCWKLHNGAKVPVNPNNGNFAKSSDSTTWGTYDTARAHYAKGGMEGLGFMFDNKAGVVGVDLDNKPDPVFDDNGELCEWARDIVSSLNSYTEVSPSGNGLHVLCTGVIPSALGPKDEHGVEMYANKRFFTMTGRHLPFTPSTLNDAQTALTALHAQYKPQHKTEARTSCNTKHVIGDNAYGTKALESAISIVSGTGDGARNSTLFNEACSILKLANGGVIGVQQSIDALVSAGMSAGLSEHEATRTVQSAVRTVGSEARYVPEKDEPANPKPTITITIEELEEIKDKEYWRGFHDGMTNAQKQTWLDLGIPEFMIGAWKLGYKEGVVDNETGELVGEGLTIPMFSNSGELQNIEYRADGGKVYYEVNRPLLFNPAENEIGDTVILIPDNIEAMMSYLHSGTLKVGGKRVSFLGLPQCKIDERIINDIGEGKNLYILLGRDTQTDGRGLGVLKGKARWTRLTCTVPQIMESMDEQQIKRILSSSQI